MSAGQEEEKQLRKPAVRNVTEINCVMCQKLIFLTGES